MRLLRCLFFFEAHHQFELVASHIAGRSNVLADDLSRNFRHLFLSKAPWMNPLPTPVPPQLPALDLEANDWTSPAWMRQLSIICTGV